MENINIIAEMTITTEENKIKLILLLEELSELEFTLDDTLKKLIEEENQPNKLLTVKGLLNILSSVYGDSFKRIMIRRKLKK